MHLFDPGNFFTVLLTGGLQTINSSIVVQSILLSLIIIYLASKIGGELVNRVGLPPVLGELLGGVVIGISGLHLLVFPEIGVDSFPSLIISFMRLTSGLRSENILDVFNVQSEVISVLAELGAIILLFEIGLEANLKDLIAVGIQSTVVAVTGVLVPLIAGTSGLIYLFHISTIPAIFTSAALTATSIGITSKILAELGHLDSAEGKIILGAAVIDDVIGIVVLAVVASLAKDGEVDFSKIVYIIIGASGFLLAAIILGNVFNQYFVAIADQLKTRGELIIPAFIFAFVMAYLASIMQLEAILGAFAAGLILEETDKRKELQKLITPIADILVPIFFVIIGAKADLRVLNPTIATNQAGLIMAAFLITVAIIGKLVTGLTVFGQENINRWAIGVGMIPRGEVGLVVVSIGAANDVLSKPEEAAIIIMVLLTTFISPPLLRLVFSKSPTPEMTKNDINDLGKNSDSQTIQAK